MITRQPIQNLPLIRSAGTALLLLFSLQVLIILMWDDKEKDETLKQFIDEHLGELFFAFWAGDYSLRYCTDNKTSSLTVLEPAAKVIKTIQDINILIMCSTWSVDLTFGRGIPNVAFDVLQIYLTYFNLYETPLSKHDLITHFGKQLPLFSIYLAGLKALPIGLQLGLLILIMKSLIEGIRNQRLIPYEFVYNQPEITQLLTNFLSNNKIYHGLNLAEIIYRLDKITINALHDLTDNQYKLFRFAMLALAGMQYCNKANLHKINNYVQASYTAAKQKLFNLPKTSTPDELLIQRHPLARFI